MTVLFEDLTIVDLAWVSGLLSITYTLWLIAYRLWLSPVAHFPGAFWPKLTFLFEFYHEWIKPGKYYQTIHEMHKLYGKCSTVSSVCLAGMAWYLTFLYNRSHYSCVARGNSHF